MPVKQDRVAVVRHILERHSLFGSLTPDELDQLIAHARVQTYAARQTIFEKGSPGLGLLAVLKGRVRISSLGREGDQVVLNIINEGDVFGEIALLDGKDRTADAAAMTECELLAIDRRDFVPFVRANPEVALRLLSVLCQRLRRTTEQVEDMIFLDAPARLAKKLVELAEQSGKPRGVKAEPVVTISQHELGNMIGLTRESINKHLSVWQQAGILKVGHGAITILDADALRQQAE
ncbi:MAG TPA: Crp/Fnr family transcriptional regulator [Stellaceae bacterium]|nr:Crp/Fnr family transcriptional regulator [Stellaceae bacterium]